MAHIKRNMANKIETLLTMFPVVAILGARQTGKSTLAQQCRPHWRYIDLENPNDYEQLSADPVLFFEQYPHSIIIDEAQLSVELFRVLRGVIDKDRTQKGRFILTGSSSPELVTHLSESLAGRIAVVQLGTLKANEYNEQPLSPFYKLFEQKLDRAFLPQGIAPLSARDLQHVWWLGGYPEPLLEGEDYQKQWMTQYNSSYVNRDIAILFPRLNHRAYQRFLVILSKLSGTIINKSDIARAIEVSEKTIREYLQIIEGTFLWRQLLSFERNITKSIIKMPKGHLRDTGILHHLLKLDSFDDLYASQYIGHSFESFVIEEILKGLESTLVTNWSASYYRTRRGAEIDLLIDGPFGVLPIEIKHSSYTTAKQINTLVKFVDEHQLPFGIVINRSKETSWITNKILQLPAGWL